MEQTVSTPDAPATPTPTPDASIASLADYEAARPQLLRDTVPSLESVESADAVRQRLLQEQETRSERTRDERGRFARQDGDAETPETPEAAPETPRESADAQNRKRNPQERIAHVVWEREQARREADAARRELDALRAQLAPPPTPEADPVARQAPPPVDASDPEPTEEQFETYREFVRAQATWAARQTLNEFVQFTQQQQQVQQQAQERDVAAATFAERIAAAEADDPALLTTLLPEVLALRPSWALQPGETPTGGTVIADLAVAGHPDPAALLRNLSAHPDEFRRISALHPMLAMRELGRFEARFEAASRGSVSTPSLSQAQPPIQPVGRGASVPTGTRDPKDISSLAEFEALRPQLMREFSGAR